MSVYISNSPEETMELGRKLAEKLVGNEVIAYFGGLGMGKTTLTRGIVGGLGGDDVVSSPTFAIVNEYRAKYNVYHFDKDSRQLTKVAADRERDSMEQVRVKIEDLDAWFSNKFSF